MKTMVANESNMEPIAIRALEETPKVGSKTIVKVLSITPTLEPNSPSDLIEILKKANAKFKKVSVPDTQAAMIGWSNANKIWDVYQQHKIQIISRASPNYPKGLLQISDPPLLLHVLGNFDAIHKQGLHCNCWNTKTNRIWYCRSKKVGCTFRRKRICCG
jgi:predicted Rossmann fold nucleotide-binding protein DprA/Smf involved in DNA uptake